MKMFEFGIVWAFWSFQFRNEFVAAAALEGNKYSIAVNKQKVWKQIHKIYLISQLSFRLKEIRKNVYTPLFPVHICMKFDVYRTHSE